MEVKLNRKQLMVREGCMTHEQIKEMLSKITQGEWYKDGNMIFTLKDGCNYTYASFQADRACPKEEKQACVDFFASAPAIIHQLLDEVDKLKRVAEAGKELGQPIPMGCFSMMFPKDKVEKLQEALKQL